MALSCAEMGLCLSTVETVAVVVCGFGIMFVVWLWKDGEEKNAAV